MPVCNLTLKIWNFDAFKTKKILDSAHNMLDAKYKYVTFFRQYMTNCCKQSQSQICMPPGGGLLYYKGIHLTKHYSGKSTFWHRKWNSGIFFRKKLKHTVTHLLIGYSPLSCGWSRCWGRGLQRWGNCWRLTPDWLLRRGRPSDPGCWCPGIQPSETGWSLVAEMRNSSSLTHRRDLNTSWRTRHCC